MSTWNGTAADTALLIMSAASCGSAGRIDTVDAGSVDATTSRVADANSATADGSDSALPYGDDPRRRDREGIGRNTPTFKV